MPAVLNDRALRQIEAVHRGFLYQHLFAVGCLLLAHPAGMKALAVERDEDVELLFDGRTRYVQVKTRQRSLSLTDVDSTLQRFAEIAAEHSSGRRNGTAEFWIVTNSTTTTALLDHVRRGDISIRFVTPENPPPAEANSPPAWSTVAAAIDWCIDTAGQIQFAGLSAQTLTWKLATEVAIASAGERPDGHSFEVTQLPDLFEQLVVALHRLPAAPIPYVPQSSEPPLASDAPVRLLVGLSGAGKTAWVAQSALHTQTQLVYIDAASTLPTALPSAIAQEVAAHFLTRGDVAARDAILPGASGLDALTSLSRHSHNSGQHVLIICDNAHLVGLETLQRAIQHAPEFRWILVGQPWPGVAAVEACFDIATEQLGGFSLEAIAEVFSYHGCPVDVATADLIHDISAGLPLFVNDAARLTERYYGGDPNRFATEVTAGTHSTSTGQEAILSQVIRRLSPSARMAAALLSIPEVHLEHQECLEFLADATGDRPDTAAADVRELTDWGVVQHYYAGSIALHDAFGLPAAGLKHELPAAVLDAGRRSLARILRASFGRGKFERLMMFFKLAPLIGESETLVDVSNSLSEHIQERGKADELIRILEDASASEEVEPINRFWAYDAVTFWKCATVRWMRLRSECNAWKGYTPQLPPPPALRGRACC